MKKSLIMFVGLALLFALPFASAGFWQWLTGQNVLEQETNVSIEVGNTPPSIIFVEPISAQTPVELTYLNVTFKFTASDHDGFDDLNDGSALAEFTRGSTSRSAACSIELSESTDKTSNYTCIVKMWYWDEPGAWDVNASISDAENLTTNTTTSFNYDSLTAFVLSPSTLLWPSVMPGQQDVNSSNDPTVLNNTGNVIINDIRINATDLHGTPDTSKIIYGSNFTSKISDPACAGTALSSSAFIQVAGASLNIGNLSIGSETAQEKLYYCLDVPSSVTKQTYTTTLSGAWTIKLV